MTLHAAVLAVLLAPFLVPATGSSSAAVAEPGIVDFDRDAARGLFPSGDFQLAITHDAIVPLRERFARSEPERENGFWIVDLKKGEWSGTACATCDMFDLSHALAQCQSAPDAGRCVQFALALEGQLYWALYGMDTGDFWPLID